MTKKLKDKIWRCCTIKIDRLVEQYISDETTTNRTKMFLVDIRKGKIGIMFNATNIKDLWKQIKREAMVWK